MKRIVVITVLAVLMLAAVGVTTAVAAPQKTVVTKKAYNSNGAGDLFGVVGTVTYDTKDGSWTFNQNPKVTLPGSGGDLYYLGITTSRPVRDKYENNDYFALLPEPDNGTITASGTADVSLVPVINQDLANGGVFIIFTGNF